MRFQRGNDAIVFRLALALSVGVVVGCGVWWSRIASSDGPDRSVDLRPLGPIVVGAAALLAIWVSALFIASITAYSRDDDNRAD